tara:strand:- start:110 stop:289 length:180 start_codon:yes stop_codon:yes gene_type:complete
MIRTRKKIAGASFLLIRNKNIIIDRGIPVRVMWLGFIPNLEIANIVGLNRLAIVGLNSL